MSKGLTTTSSPLTVSDFVTITTTGATDFQVKQVDLQLNPLDNEVFVITGVKIDFLDLPKPDLVGGGLQECHFEVSVCKARPATAQRISNSNCVASSRINTFSQSNAANEILSYTAMENNAVDTPPLGQEYLDIVATDNMFLSFHTLGELQVGQSTNAAVRVYGYRARASSSVYAALVQSEMLSAN